MSKLVSQATLLQKTVKFKELALYQYRQLLKCFIGEDVDFELIYNNTNIILQNLVDLPETEIKQLNFIDYFLLLFYIRQISIGDYISLYVIDNEEKQVKADLRVQNLINELYNSEVLNLLLPESTDIGEIYYRLPTIDEILFLEKNSAISPYTFFLQKIKFSNLTIELEKYSYEEREILVQKIPVKILTNLTKRTQQIIDTINKFNLLKSINNNSFDKILPFTLNTEILGFVYKLVYNTNLEGIYDCMFALTKAANFSCTFLDNCSPGEFYLFVKKLEQINSQQQNTNNQTVTSTHDNLPPITSEADFGLE